jgi:hypothetical protein
MEIEDLMDLDTKWIEEFENIDDNYKEFYREDVTYIRLNCVYVNKDNDIEKMKEETILLKEVNYISREELIEILKKNHKIMDKKYNVLSILKCNIDIEPTDVQDFLKNKYDEEKFITVVKNIDTIPLEKTISMFHDLNEIIVLFYEKDLTEKKLNLTKRIYINATQRRRKKTYRKQA